MGQLTGGVAHDFNNLLAPIMGSLDLLKRRGVGGDREKRLIEAALESAHRAKTLVHRLLAFARRQPLRPAAVDIATLLTEIKSLVETTLGAQIRLSLDLAPELPAAVADRNQLEMAVLNLAVNARAADAPSSPSFRPRASARAPASDFRWCMVSPRNSAVRSS
jgi:nitrogen-specific signal transduction histidine kinase